MINEWHHHFFDGLAVDFWVAVAPSPAEDLAFLESLFGAPAGQPILDLAAGAGRHAIPLTGRGYRVTAVDISQEFLDRGRALASGRGVAVDWQRHDIRDLPWTGQFDGALCFGNSWGYFDRENMLRVLGSIARSLRSGAALVVETGTVAECLLPALQDRRWFELEELLVLSEATYDAMQSRLDVRYSFIRGEAREVKTAHYWVYTTRELREMFALCGLRVEHGCSSSTNGAFRLGSPRLLLVARKD